MYYIVCVCVPGFWAWKLRVCFSCFIAVLDTGCDCWPLFLAGLLIGMKHICIGVPYLREECRGLGKQMCGDSVSANCWKV